MNTVIIVDDEKLIREGIKKNIDWEGESLYLIGEAENGLDAIYMIEQQVPDILLLDICMPMMDGLELAKAVKQRYPRTSIVMVTGFDEFNFVRTALKIGVEDYILKPITPEKIAEALDKVREKRTANIGRGKEAEELSRLLYEKKMCRILKGAEESVEGDALPLAFDMDADLFAVARLGVKEIFGECWQQAMNKSDLINFAILNITNELLLEKRMGFAMLSEDSEVIIVFSAEDEEDEFENITEMAGTIAEAIESYIQIQVSIGVGKVVQKFNRISSSYTTAKIAHDFRLLDEELDIIVYNNIKAYHDIKMIYPRELEERLLNGLLGDDSTKQDLNTFFNYVKTNNAKMSDIRSAVFMLVASVLRYARDYDISPAQVRDADVTILDELGKYENIVDLFSATADYVLAVKDILIRYKSRPKQLADKITTFIEENYDKEDLSLAMMAKDLFISTSYISAIFKNDIGRSFVDYLTDIRVAKAKQLLSTSQNKTYEIGAMVGYRTPQYFSTIFKKETGQTPSEFRKNLNNK